MFVKRHGVGWETLCAGWFVGQVIVAYVLQMSLGIVNLLFVGHLDNDASIFAAGSSLHGVFVLLVLGWCG